jgi:hypothetical protein
MFRAVYSLLVFYRILTHLGWFFEIEMEQIRKKDFNRSFIKQNKGFSPMLLLDDIFEKLDSERMNNLLHKVCIEESGQVFITDTHTHRLKVALQNIGVPFQLIELE